MRRKTRRLIANLAFFCCGLLLLIYLNYQQSTDQTFAWTTIRYKSTSATLPPTRGVCPGLENSSKPALVVARVTAEDSKWLDVLADLYHLCVYTADGPTDASSVYLQVPANRGHEAMAYLTFIIDNYAHIPAAGAVFVHGSRWAWHNDAPDYDNAALLASLNVSAALAPWGYHNLRCDWSASMCSTSETPPQGSLETSARALLEPWNIRAASDNALPGSLLALFGGDVSDTSDRAGVKLLLGRNDAVRAQCCAQFVVARDRVWQHSRDEYVALRQWLLDGRNNHQLSQKQQANVAPPDDRVAGRILSYVWHILFMPRDESGNQDSSPAGSRGVDLERLNSLACPRADECYCRLYGRCNLEGCNTPGRCHGQYRVPPNYQLPDDWGSRHS